MITLAELNLGWYRSSTELRQKIFAVSRTLGYSEVEAGRLATVWSQLIRSETAALTGASLGVAIDVRTLPGTFHFHLDGPAIADISFGLLRHCCDTVRLERLDGEGHRIIASTSLPPQHTLFDDEMIAGLRSVLSKKSVHQLTKELEDKNAELEKHQANLERTIEARTAELTASHSMLASIQASMNQGLSAYDENFNLIGWNERFRKFYRLPEGFLKEGLPLADIIRFLAERGDYGDGDRDDLIASRLALLSSGDGAPIEIMIGGERIYELFSNLRSDGGLVITYTDVTDRKAMEKELIKAREAAEVAAETKANFLATMSHEIRTPMNGVMSMSEILDQTPLTADQRSMTKTIRQSADALLTVINDILDFSKIEAGKLDIEDISFDLVDVIESTADLLAPRAEEKSVDFLVEIDASVPRRLSGDPSRVRQLLLNLGSNAIKFTGEGSVEFRVSVVGGENYDPDALMVRFEIVDTGIGLTVEQQSRLFNAFTQANSSTSRKYGGTGLGLSICKRLCELMRGYIGVCSALGEGSNFWFELPFKVEEGPFEPEHDLTAAKVLLIGYSSREGEIISRYLERGGVSAVSCALTAFSKMPPVEGAMATLGGAPDLVLVNAKPGLHVVRSPIAALSGLEGMVGRPVVLTAYHAAVSTLGANELDRENMVLQGALTCPIRLKRIWHMVAVALGKAEIGNEAITEEGSQAVYEPPDMGTAHAHNAAILVAEDNETNQIVIRRILSRLGFAHDIAKNGEEAIALYRQYPYGLILTDFHMPKMDGFELTSVIRKMEDMRAVGRPIPIVALTADALPKTEQQCLDAGMNGYLRKPIEMAKLEAILNRYLKHALPLRGAYHPISEPNGDGASAIATVNTAIFDPAQLEDSFGPFDTDAALFVVEFLGSLEERIHALEDALSTDDQAQARSIAHAQKGACLSIGARRMGQIMGEIQDMLDSENTMGARLIVKMLSENHRDLKLEVDSFCKKYLH